MILNTLFAVCVLGPIIIADMIGQIIYLIQEKKEEYERRYHHGKKI